MATALSSRWSTVPLGRLIIDTKNGLACGDRSATGCLQVRMNNVDLEGHLDLSDSIRIPTRNSEFAEFGLESGDVLFNNTNSMELVGKTALFTGYSEAVLFSNHFTRLRCDHTRLLPSYLARWLTKQQRSHVFEGLCNRWVNQSAVRKEAVLGLAIPLPYPDDPAMSLTEQKRIAAILDKADAIRSKSRMANDVFDGLSGSLFQTLFGQYLRQPTAEMPRLGDPEMADIASGVTKGRRFSGQRTVIVPYIRVANVQDGYLDLNEVKTIEALPSDVDALRLQHGDVLMTEGGDFDKLGRGALWEADIPDCIHQNHVFRVRCNRRNLLPEYLAHYIRTEIAKGYFLRCAKKTSNLASMNMTQLRATPVACPPIELQERFTAEVERINHRKRRHDAAVRDTDSLFNSLIYQAFRGDL